MTAADPTTANVTIARALGLDPTLIKPGGVTITLDRYYGPIVEVHYRTLASDGAIDETAQTLCRYRLVLLEEDTK